MSTKTSVSDQRRVPGEADTSSGSRRGLPSGSGGAGSPGKFRELMVICAWAVAGFLLTVAVIWFGLEIQ